MYSSASTAQPVPTHPYGELPVSHQHPVPPMHQDCFLGANNANNVSMRHLQDQKFYNAADVSMGQNAAATGIRLNVQKYDAYNYASYNTCNTPEQFNFQDWNASKSITEKMANVSLQEPATYGSQPISNITSKEFTSFGGPVMGSQGYRCSQDDWGLQNAHIGSTSVNERMQQSEPADVYHGSQYSMGHLPPAQSVGPPMIQPSPLGQHMPPPVLSSPATGGPSYPGQAYQPLSAPNAPSFRSYKSPAPYSQPQQRVNLDMLPSAVQVQLTDQEKRGGLYDPNMIFNRDVDGGVCPPLVTTDFYCQQKGSGGGANCNPNYIRSTLYTIPCTSDFMKQLNLNFGISISPFTLPHEKEPQNLVISDMGPQGPVRCVRCKAYMSPFMLFVDGGKRFQCALCGAFTDVPTTYFVHLDHTGYRMDTYQRAELCLGSYEILATKEYCRNEMFPEVPAFIFMLDVSSHSNRNGLVKLFCEHLKGDILSYLPKEGFNQDSPSSIRVGFVTYDKVLYFYNLKKGLSQPQVQIVSDVSDVFVPLVDGFFVTVEEVPELIDNLLLMVMEQFANNSVSNTIFGPAIEAGLDALKASGRCGKLFIFHSSIPTAEAPGKLKHRDDRSLLGTDKEKLLFTPSSNYYTELGKRCVADGCSVDVFLFPNAYIDVASMSEVSRLTGGRFFKYNYFHSQTHADQFLYDLKNAVKSVCALDACLRIRTSTGTRPVDFYGNFSMQNSCDVDLCGCDYSTNIVCEIKHDDKLSEENNVVIQVACLYTSVSGQKRIRIHNLAISTSNSSSDIFKNSDIDTMMNLWSKMALRLQIVQGKTSREVREMLSQKCTQILAVYRKNCVSSHNLGELVLPDQMKLLLLYCNCLCNSDALTSNCAFTITMPNSQQNPDMDLTTDDRSYIIFLLNRMSVRSSNLYIYPRLLPLHKLDVEGTDMPIPIRCSLERLEPSGMYLLANGILLFLWIGSQISADFLLEAFGFSSVIVFDSSEYCLKPINTPMSRRVFEVIEHVRRSQPAYMRTVIVRQNEKSENWFKYFMVEDGIPTGASSYVDYVCHVHREVRSILDS